MNPLMKLLVALGLDTKDYDSGVDDAQKKAQAFGKSMDKLGGKLQKTGAVMTAAVTVPVIAGFTAMINSASNLSESINAINVIFGEGADAVLEYGKTAATTVGLSNSAFNQMATTTGAFLQNVGFNARLAGDETIKLTERAADMASVFNTDVADAMAAIQSGLKGEFNPLERFGVKLNAAAIEAKALEMGLADATGELSDNAKAAAALQLIYEQTAIVQGDFVNTSDQLANSTRILKGQLEDAAASLGTALLPTALRIVTKLNELVQVFNDMSPATQTTILQVAALAAAIGPVVTVIGTLIKVVGAVTTFLAGPALLAVAPYAAAILGIALAVKLVVNAVKKHNAAIGDATSGFRKQNQELTKTSESYEDYRRNAIKSAKATGVINEYIDISTAEMYGMGAAEEEAAIKMGVLTQAQYDLQKAVEGATQASKDIIDPQERLRQSMEDSSGATAGLVTNTDLLNQQMDELRLFMSGPLGEEMDNFYQREGDLEQQAQDLQGEIDNLNGKSWLTTAQKDQLEENKGKLKEIEDQIKKNADEHELATKRILFDLLQQQLAMDGLTTDEGNMLAVVAEKWGLVDDETATAYQKISDYVQQVKDGKISVEELADMVAKLGDKDIYLTTHFIETYQSDAPAWEYSGGGTVTAEAYGGGIMEGSPYIYNENPATRPEMFVASQSGYMLTRQDAQEAVANGARGNANGGKGDININVYGAADPNQTANLVNMNLKAAFALNGA